MNPAPHADRDHSEWTPDRLATLRDAITPSTSSDPDNPTRDDATPASPQPGTSPGAGSRVEDLPEWERDLYLEQARRERYAEAILGPKEVGTPVVMLPGRTYEESRRVADTLDLADREQAEKDATIAELRAEVERLGGVVDVLAKRNEDDAERWSGVLSEAEARVAELEATVAKAKAEALREAADASLSCDEDWNGTCCDTCRERGLWLRNRAAILDAPKDTTAEDGH